MEFSLRLPVHALCLEQLYGGTDVLNTSTLIHCTHAHCTLIPLIQDGPITIISDILPRCKHADVGKRNNLFRNPYNFGYVMYYKGTQSISMNIHWQNCVQPPTFKEYWNNKFCS